MTNANTDKAVELKSCPCGGKAEVRYDGYSNPNVKCRKSVSCGNRTPHGMFLKGEESKAIAWWNNFVDTARED